MVLGQGLTIHQLSSPGPEPLVSKLGLDNLDPEHVKLCLNLRIIIFTNAPERKLTVRMFVILLLGY